jgi:hypothetical protein
MLNNVVGYWAYIQGTYIRNAEMPWSFSLAT